MTAHSVVAVALLTLLTAAASSAQSAPELLGRGVISTDAPEFAFAATPDGSTIFFNRASADRASLTIMTASRDRAGGWTSPTVAPFSGTYRDVDPFVTPDGRRLFFSSDRPRDATGTRTFATWVVERTASGWSAPRDPGSPLNSTAGDVFFTMARDGTAVFTSSREGSSRIYATRMAGGVWTTPLAVSLGTTIDAGNPAIAASGRFMIVVRPGAGGDADLFWSCRATTGWTEPRALTAVNSPFADFAPHVDPAEATLTFTSERPGLVGPQPPGARPPGDLYRVLLSAAGVRCP